MIPIQDFLTAIVKDKKINEEGKNALMSVYFISLYKVFLELLIGLKGNDQDFVRRLTEFFNAEWQQLQPGEKEAFVDVFAQNKKKILTHLEQIVTSSAD